MSPRNPDAALSKALAQRAQDALSTLSDWEDPEEIYEATLTAIADVQKVVKESGMTAGAWNTNAILKEDVLSFLHDAKVHFDDLRATRTPVLNQFTLYPNRKYGNETYTLGGETLDKVDDKTPLSLLLQSALVAHMVIFARANGSIHGTIFQNSSKRLLTSQQKICRERYLQGMLVGIVQNLNILGWDRKMRKKAAVSTMVRHLPSMTSALISGDMIRSVLKNAGGKYALQTDDWIEKEYSFTLRVRILVGNPASIEHAILAHATSSLFLGDDSWLEGQLNNLMPAARQLALHCLKTHHKTFNDFRSEESLKARLRVLRDNAVIFTDDVVLRKELEEKHAISLHGSIENLPISMFSYFLDSANPLEFFARFLRNEVDIAFGPGRHQSDAIRAKLKPHFLNSPMI